MDHAQSGGSGPADAPEDGSAPSGGLADSATRDPETSTPSADGGRAPEDDQPAWRRGALGCIVEIAQTLVLTLVLFLGIQAFIAQPFQVQQHSMERTFIENDYVLVDRLTPRFAPYQRGQVIVFNPPDGWEARKDPFIKRIIGVAGDRIELKDGAVWVNGAKLDEPYLYRDEAGNVEPTDPDGETKWTLGDGELFVMGDHRQASADSRAFGTIPVSSVIGRGVVRYWPPSRLWIVQSATYDNVPAP